MATKKSMQELKIYNEWEYANGNPFLYYSSQIPGRGWRSAGWRITWPNHPFSSVWGYDRGDIVVDVFRPRFEKELKLEEAKKKFQELFGDEELVPTPFGGWMPKSFVEKRNKEIKEMLKKSK